MKIIGIDTATKNLSIGIYNNNLIYEYNLEAGRGLSALLAPTIKRILDTLGWQAEDLDYIASGLGPGSFTGLRVGLAAVKGIAWSLKKPVIGISTLDILARNFRQEGAVVVPMIDAKRSLIYCSVYQNQAGAQKRIAPYMLLSQEEFFKKIKPKSIIFGDGVGLYQEKIRKNIKAAAILDKDYWYPRAHNLVELALERIREKKFRHPFNLEPVYLYPKDCQIKK